MKKISLAFFGLSLLFLGSLSCKKINEATTLGGDLIPPVDNVNTFEIALETNTINSRFDDSLVVVGYGDAVALGDVNDPEFGNVHANFAFSFSSPAYGSYPFLSKKDSVGAIDSVVLTLSYVGAYGDTLGNGIQTVSVHEIDQNAGFLSDTSYRYNDPASDFSGSLLGSKTYTISKLKDTSYVEEPGDTAATTKYTNVLRITLNNSLGQKLINFDTAKSSSNGGFVSDSAFKHLFPGLAIRSANSGNALAYFNLTEQSNTKLTVYYRYKKNGTDTSVALNFRHSTFGQANYVDVQPGGNWAASLNTPNSDRVYLSSSPSGSFASVVIPGLDTLSNKVIHRAELIAERIPAAGDNIFAPPFRLFLARNNKGVPDTSFTFPLDLVTGVDGGLDFNIFGGALRNNSYQFNITRHVQRIITRNEPNDTLRLYAPLRTVIFNPALADATRPRGQYQIIGIGNRIMEGRVVLAGGNYAVPSQRLRLRIIYSNL